VISGNFFPISGFMRDAGGTTARFNYRRVGYLSVFAFDPLIARELQVVVLLARINPFPLVLLL
jgi:hypothetical protein